MSSAKRNLEEQINEYVHEAITVDREHAYELLNRKAPFPQRAEYWMAWLVQKLTPRKREQCAFQELVVPA